MSEVDDTTIEAQMKEELVAAGATNVKISYVGGSADYEASAVVHEKTVTAHGASRLDALGSLKTAVAIGKRAYGGT